MKRVIPLDGTYLVKEVTKGFTETKFCDTVIKQREFEGTVYVTFSNICRVEIAPIGGAAEVGDYIVVEHFVLDQRTVIDGEEYYVAFIEQIMAVTKEKSADPFDESYLYKFQPVNGFLALPKVREVEGFENSQTAETDTDDNVSTAFSGEKLEYLKYADYEIYRNDKRYHYIKEKDCYLIDGECNEDYFMELNKEGESFSDKYGNTVLLISKDKVFQSRDGRYITYLTNLVGWEVNEVW